MPAPSIPTTPAHVSVNRVRLVDLPGLAVDEAVRGQLAYHLLSVPALIGYAREHADALGLPEHLRTDEQAARRDLPRLVDACLAGPAGPAREAAGAVAQRLGRNLGYILLALRRGDAVNRAARGDWTDADWARWAEIERVWLAGGLMSGHLGERIVAAARDLLAKTGYTEVLQIAVSPYCEHTPLLGAGRYAAGEAACVLACDFGHTFVKRACLSYTQGTLQAMELYPSLPVPFELYAGVAPNALRDFMVDVIGRAWETARASGKTPYPELLLSVAAYVDGGRLLGNGLYAQLHRAVPDGRPYLETALARRCGQALRVRLIHDGTAAAAVHAGAARSAVILVGTALGVGFPPAWDHDLRPLGAGLAV